MALLLRLFALAAASGRAPFGDPVHYLDMAQSVLAGDGLVAVQGTFLSRALFPPAYPLLLAGVGTVFPLSPVTLTVLNTSLDIGAALLLYKLAEQLGAKAAARPAALAYLCWPSIALAAPLANKESLSLLLMLATLVAFLRSAERGAWRWSVLCGAAAGLTLLAQPALAPVLPVLLLLLADRFPDFRSWLAAAALAAAFALLVLLPWWVRNYWLLGSFVPLTTSGGHALWVGAQHGGGFTWRPYPPAWLGKTEVELSRTAVHDAWEIISSDPLAYLGRCLAKLPASFLRPNLALLNLAYMTPPPWPGLLRIRAVQLLPTLVELIPVTLAMAGLVTLRRSLPARLLLGSLAACLLFLIWFEFSERHRLFMTPFILLLAMMTLLDMRQAIGRDRSPGPSPRDIRHRGGR